MDPNNPNLYSYCGNNTVNRVDPKGTEYTDIYGSMSYTYTDIYGSQSNYNGPGGGPGKDSGGGSNGGSNRCCSTGDKPKSINDISDPELKQKILDYYAKVAEFEHKKNNIINSEKEPTGAELQQLKNEYQQLKKEAAEIRKALGISSSDARQSVADYARNNLNDFQYGRNGTTFDYSEGIPKKGTLLDCSCIPTWAYEQIGIDLPAYTDSQYWYCENIGAGIETDINKVQVGDLVFITDPSKKGNDLWVDGKGNSKPDANEKNTAIDHVMLVTKVVGNGKVEVVQAHGKGKESDTKVIDMNNSYYGPRFVGYGKVL